MTPSSMVLAIAATAVLGGSTATAHADAIKCAAATKKLEWHVCVKAEVEYKRGMKTESRNECKVDKVIKPTGGCNFGDLGKHIPAGADVANVVFYAIGPVGFDSNPWETQMDPTGFCSMTSDQDIDGYELMKFSEAFDKSNSDRSDLVKDKLKAKKKALFPYGVRLRLNPQGCPDKSAKMGVLDKKSLSEFLIYAEYKFAE